MSDRLKKALALTFFLNLPQSTAAAPPKLEVLSVLSDPCTTQEQWPAEYLETIPYKESFLNSIRRKESTVLAFSKALDLRLQSTQIEEKHFSEYWISRSLFRAGLIHAALSGFEVIATDSSLAPSTLPEQAALGCIYEIHRSYPSLSYSPQLIEHFQKILSQENSFGKSPALVDLMVSMIAQTRKPFPAPLMKLLKTHPSHEAFVQTLLSAQSKNTQQTIRAARLFIRRPIPSSLLSYRDEVRLLLARALYRSKKFNQSVAIYRSIPRRSNLYIDSLSELSWAYLMNGKQEQAVGTGTTLLHPSMTQAFAPEAPMVAAIALNELCQFPSSISMLKRFRNEYASTYEWISKNKKLSGKNTPYSLSLEYLTKKKTTVPPKVISEWIRSPLFLSRQKEINLGFREVKARKTMAKEGERVQTRLVSQLEKNLDSLLFRYDRLKKEKKIDPNLQTIPEELSDQFDLLKLQVETYHALLQAAPIWKNILLNQEERMKQRQSDLIALINKELRIVTHRMRLQLEEIAENNQLIEIEILSGASQDLVWKNANPHYQVAVAESERQRKRTLAATTWNWGRKAVQVKEDEEEVWEDELASSYADLPDNCSNKEKYLALKLEESSR